MEMFGFLKSRRKTRDPLVEQHYQSLLRDGFAHISGGYPSGVIDETLAGVKRLYEKNNAVLGRYVDADGHYPRIMNLHTLYSPLLKLFTENPVALAVQDAFFGRPSVIYTSIYFERGSAQAIHRDTPYFCTKPDYQYLGVWVALEDADEVNGCLQVMRGGHLIPESDREALALQHYPSLDDVPPISELLWYEYQNKVMSDCVARGLAPERIPAKAGDVVIWHPQLPHGGSSIQDMRRSRNSFVMHVTPENVPVYHQDVFFNPKKLVPDTAKSKYAKYRGRKYAKGDFIDIDDKERRPNKDMVL